MSYQALYRTFRSQTFDGVVGQIAVSHTLKNAIIQEKTSHAYLFTGPRGTGKTSMARIFAKAVNCPNVKEGEPCNTCSSCLSITQGSLDDVIEVDAASNNGVEEIRKIRDTAIFPPTIADKKVYIIDEVHMLSMGAFNALLKTLEEPPVNVIFILATTEVHKVPATILSRCQRFDFKRIQIVDIVAHMKKILADLNIAYEEEALFIIARSAQGGMRDALSILDMAISFSEDSVTVDDANSVTGSLTYEKMDEYLGYIEQKQCEQALETLESILSEGKETKRFLEDMLLYLRDLLMYGQAPKLIEEKYAQMRSEFIRLSQSFSTEKIFSMIEVFHQATQDIRLSSNPQIQLEVVTVKLLDDSSKTVKENNAAVSGSQSEIDSLKQEILLLQKEIDALKENGLTVSKQTKVSTLSNQPSTSSYKEPIERVLTLLPKANKSIKEELINAWTDLLHLLTVPQRANFTKYSIVAATPNTVVLVYKQEVAFLAGKVANDADFKRAVQNGLARLTAYSPELIPMSENGWNEVLTHFKDGKQESEVQAKQELPIVEQAKELFGDLVQVKDE